jgi:hypothetical protein
MDELDKILTENRSQFDEEPLAGHFERFEEKLMKQNKNNWSRKLTPTFLKIASVLIIMLLLADIIINTKKPKPELQAKIETSTDIGEAAIYYTTRINSGINQLEELSQQGVGSEKEVQQIKKEMAEMDSLFVNLKKEYNANPNDERIINAMIEYYQTKLNIVNTIKSDLENVKQQKRKYNENTKI